MLSFENKSTKTAILTNLTSYFIKHLSGECE